MKFLDIECAVCAHGLQIVCSVTGDDSHYAVVMNRLL